MLKVNHFNLRIGPLIQPAMQNFTTSNATVETLKDKIYTIAIIGRPNVGKSTLFNRLMGSKLALVDKTPGLTRDRKEGITELFGIPIRLVDTAGFEGTEQLNESSLKTRSLN